MKTVAVICLLALLTLSIRAQQPKTGTATSSAKVVTAAELAAIIAKQPKDKNGTQAFMEFAPYSVNMEHRITGQGAAVHEKDAELFYVIDGSGTLVTGGKLVDEKRTNESNLSGSSIQGGVSKKVSKGDWMVVPQGVPHQFPSVDGNLTLMSVHLPRSN